MSIANCIFSSDEEFVNQNILAVFRFFKQIIFIVLISGFNAALAQNPIPSVNQISATHLKFNDDTSKLQFAIVSDLWGGYRPGVFEDAVSKLELLQPQFVMSVGDLIDGNTYNLDNANQQWLTFNNRVKDLSMPFFYVPGNHDIGNPFLEKVWKEKLGNPYYHFVKNNVLFLCVNTEDGGHGGIKNDQISYFKKAINDNPNVRWTFIFMHRPVWFTEGLKQEGYEQIESFLKGKKYTLFSGHHHTYLNTIKNGNKHFVLGSTGGGSDMRGEKYGEFDHITLVTLKNNEEPKIVNLKLEGIIKEDVVNEKTHPITNTLINGNWFITPSYVAEKRMEKELNLNIQFNNPTAYPLDVTGKLLHDLYQITPEIVKITIPANSVRNQSIKIHSKNNQLIDLAKLTSIDLTLNGSYTFDSFKYEIPAQKQLLTSWKYQIPIDHLAKKTIQNMFDLKDTTAMISLNKPEYLKNKWYWSGKEDADVQFKLMHDTENVYVLAFIKDDQLVIGQDEIIIYIENHKAQLQKFTITPNKDKSIIKAELTNTISVKATQLNLKIENENFIKLMITFPKNEMLKTDQSIRFNIGYHDQDNLPEKRFSDIFWKPIWNTIDDYQNSGTFKLN